MAYDQNYYQPPGRPYNGRAAQRPGPPQGYNQPPPPQQQYHPQVYDQYAQDGYDGYENGYAQDYNEGYQDMNGGGRGNGYPPQNQNYPPQQEYYGEQRGGRGMPPPNRGRGAQGPQPQANGYQSGYQNEQNGYQNGPDQGPGQGRGYSNGAPPGGRGARPPMDRAATSDSQMRGQQSQGPRRPLKTPPRSPNQNTFDNPFPVFPGAKKKPSVSEEQKVTQQMANMEIGGPPQNRPRTAGSKGSQDRYGGRGPTDDYGRPSIDSQNSQRSMPTREYPPRGQSRAPPQQGYPDQRRGPPAPEHGYNGTSQNGYGKSGYDDRDAYGGGTPISPMRAEFGPPVRSMTTPNEAPMMPVVRQQPAPMGGARPDERPYNGPIGRAMPPRPSTATGTRQPPQRMHPDQVQPPPQQFPPSDPYANNNQSRKPYHKPDESISDFYDSYYEAPNPAPPRQGRSQSNESEMPNFDVFPAEGPMHRRGASIDGHIQSGYGSQPRERPSEQAQNGYQQVKPMQSQPDIRAWAQPQAAVFEMANEAPPVPNASQGYPNDGYAPQNGQYNGQQPQGGPDQGYDFNQPRPNEFPPRSASAAPRPNGTNGDFIGLPGGPAPLGAVSNGPPRQNPSGNGDGLPAHPPPVRAGLVSNVAQPNNKPPPVRNYNNVSPAQQTAPSQSPPAPQAPQGPAPVTAQELEQLRHATKLNPNDQAAQMTLARKLGEASAVLVTDPPSRNKIRERYDADAQKIVKKLVAAQNTDAMFFLADCFGRGALGLITDNREAFTLYQSAAKLGHAAAAYRTAVCCELGQEEGGGTRKDPLKAIQWYKRAAMLGDTPAMYKMGMIQLKGLLGQPKSPREAVGWLKRAAERADSENPHALHELGLLYEQPQTGEGSILRDEAYSFSLFKQAADLGYKFSQFRLGCAFEYGLFNCTIDPRQSIMWYSRAAVQDEHQSELALSGWYLTGSEGVLQQSDTEAYLWARKAAMAGLAKAEYAMGYFTEVGIGSPASLEDAKRWYWRAAAQNFPKARERLEDLKKGGSKAGLKGRERISRSKVGKANEGECLVM